MGCISNFVAIYCLASEKILGDNIQILLHSWKSLDYWVWSRFFQATLILFALPMYKEKIVYVEWKLETMIKWQYVVERHWQWCWYYTFWGKIILPSSLSITFSWLSQNRIRCHNNVLKKYLKLRVFSIQNQNQKNMKIWSWCYLSHFCTK